MQNPATIQLSPASTGQPERSGASFRPADDNTGNQCFRPADDSTRNQCFRPADDGTGNQCFRPADDGNGGRCFRPADDHTGNQCFRPADDEPLATGTGRPVSSGHHPSEPGDHAGRPEGLAADLHRTLSEFERQHLAGLSSRS
jgi:hypothetical protein